MIQSMGCKELYFSENFVIFQQQINSPRAFHVKRGKIRNHVHHVILPRGKPGLLIWRLIKTRKDDMKWTFNKTLLNVQYL